MSESILSDVNLGETIIRDLHKKYSYSPVTIPSEDLKVGKKYLCIINDMDEPINSNLPLKNICAYILRYKGEKNLRNMFAYNFDVLEESSKMCRLMNPPEVGKEYFIDEHSIESDEVLLYFFDRERFNQSMKPYYKRITEKLPIPEDVQKETFKYLYNKGGKMRKTRRQSKSHKSKRRRQRKRMTKRRQ